MKNLSPTICAIPFVSLMVNTDTSIRYCCMVKGNFNKIRKEDGSGYTIKDQFVKEAWNSQDMRDIRLAMIKGERVKGCSACYLQEESGRLSNRQQANNEWSWRLGEEELTNTIKQALENDGIVENELVYLDLRLGNLCNLKCRMCNPWNSSQIAKEHIELEKKDSDYKEAWTKAFGKFSVGILEEQQWFDSNIMWDQVIELIPKLKKVYLTGGEPTLIKNNFRFMQACIDQGRTDIVLFFNLNCTNINKNFLNLISKFKHVKINASIDGVEVVNDYIRYPSEWLQVSKNVELLAKMSNVELGITPTVQVYNIFDLTNILDWVEELRNKFNNKIFVDFLINFHPHYLNVNILPDNLRDQAAKDLEIFLKEKSKLPELTINSIKGIIGLLKNDRADDWQEQLDYLRKYTRALDKERAQTINYLDSRLSKLINDDPVKKIIPIKQINVPSSATNPGNILDSHKICLVNSNTKEKSYFTVEELRGKNLNEWKGWWCSAGIRSIYIHHDGLIYKGTCEEGGIIGSIYNTGFPTDKIAEWIQCTKNNCVCGSDMLSPKVKEFNDIETLYNSKSEIVDYSTVPSKINNPNIVYSLAFDEYKAVIWEIGRRCNYDCWYCFPDSHNNFESQKSFGTLKAGFEALSTLWANDERLKFIFTGGEPTFNPDFLEFATYLKNLGHMIHTTTNGSHKAEYYSQLAKISEITFSAHLKYLENQNMFDKFVLNVKTCKEAQELINNNYLSVRIMLDPGKLEIAKRLYDECTKIIKTVFVDKIHGSDKSIIDYSVEELEWIEQKNSQ